MLLLDLVHIVAMCGRGRRIVEEGGRNVLCVCCVYVCVVSGGKLRTSYPDGGGVRIVSH
jgi:hypothetical protein